MGDSSLGTSEPFGQAQTLLPDSLRLCRPPLPRWVFLLQPPPTPHPGPGRQSLPSLDTDHHHPPALSPRRGQGQGASGGPTQAPPVERRQVRDPRGGGHPRLSFLSARPLLFTSGRLLVPTEGSQSLLHSLGDHACPFLGIGAKEAPVKVYSEARQLPEGPGCSTQPHSTRPPCPPPPRETPPSLLSWLHALLACPGHGPGVHRAHHHYKHRTLASQIPGHKCSPVFCEYFALNRTQDIDTGKPLG